MLLVVFVGALLYVRYPGNPASFQQGGAPLDFGVYHRAWSRVEARENPYVVADPSPYKYSPGALALVQYLPRDPAAAWKVYSSLCILALMAALLIGARTPTWKSVLWLALGLGAAWKGIIETFDYGQLEVLLLALAVASAALRRRQPLISGLLGGTLPWLKLPWVLLFLPLCLVNVQSLSGSGRKEKRVRLVISGYLLAWFFWGAAFPALVFGTERAQFLTRGWFHVLAAQPKALFLSDLNQSAWISALRWSGVHPMMGFGVMACLLGLFLGVFSARLLKVVPGREVFSWLTPWLILVQLLNPLSWRWGSVFLVGAFFSMALESRLPRWSRWLSAAFAAFWFLLQLNPVVQALGLQHWSVLHAYGVVTAYWFSMLLLCL